jgi:Asp-tRNA(Asn)/Glu-tRNA(Gln) amidotransferase A subunit family amidase
VTLRKAGAVIIAKTNVPQTLLAFESANPLWGRTYNPWSTAHTAGGSSGGEGALLAMDGAAIGVGSDVGGSIRIPSGYCGIYGLKPGLGRVSFAGSAGALFCPSPLSDAVVCCGVYNVRCMESCGAAQRCAASRVVGALWQVRQVF